MMTNYINEMNRSLAATSGMDPQQVESMIQQNAMQLHHVNGLLVDLLREKGLLQNVQ
mgnify:CR=1 FL=1